MNENQLRQRIALLIRVYKISRVYKALSTSQRICLTMERVACMHALDVIGEKGVVYATPKYTLPPALNDKVMFIAQQAENVRA